MRCKYIDNNNNVCKGVLVFIGEYRQEDDLVTVYQCVKCGCITEVV